MNAASRRVPYIPVFLRTVWREHHEEFLNEQGQPMTFEEFFELSIQRDPRVVKAVQALRRELGEDEWAEQQLSWRPYDHVSSSVVNRAQLRKDRFEIAYRARRQMSFHRFLIIVLAGDPAELERARGGK